MQAPQSPASQPILVPVRRRRSRSVSASEANGGAWTTRRSPLTWRVKVAAVMRLSARRLDRRKRRGSRRPAPAPPPSGKRHSPARRRSGKGRPGAEARRRRRPRRTGTPARSASSAGRRRAARPSRRPRRCVPRRCGRRVGLDGRRDHGDRDHEVAPRPELHEAPTPVALRDEDGGHDVPRSAGCRAIAGEEVGRRNQGGRRRTGDLEGGVEGEQVRDAVARRRGGAGIADDRAAVLHLEPADLARGVLQAVEERRQVGADQVGPGGQRADADVVAPVLDAAQLGQARDVEHVLVDRIAPGAPGRVGGVDVGAAGDDGHVLAARGCRALPRGWPAGSSASAAPSPQGFGLLRRVVAAPQVAADQRRVAARGIAVAAAARRHDLDPVAGADRYVLVLGEVLRDGASPPRWMRTTFGAPSRPPSTPGGPKRPWSMTKEARASPRSSSTS